MAPAGFRHGVVAHRLAVLLETVLAASAHRTGEITAAETGFRIARDPDTVRAPDLAYVSADRLPAEDGWDGFLDAVPDLVVEVVSPSDRAGDVLDKAASWLAAGTAVVWVVYPRQRTVAVHRPDGVVTLVGPTGVLDGTAVLPGLHIDVADVFPARGTAG